MPKSNFRPKYMEKRVRSCSGVAAFQTTLTYGGLLSTPPRKVSFEDTRNDSDLLTCSDDTIPTKNNKIMQAGETEQSGTERRSPMRRKRSLLVRPITSLSLVDLAKSVAYDGLCPVKSEQSDGDEIEASDTKRIRSFNLSPRSVLHTSDIPDGSRQVLSSLQPSSDGESKSLTTSPWGHFIDMAPDEDEYSNLPTSSYLNHDCMPKTNQERVSPLLCKEPPRRTRRRPSPYGQYNIYTRRQEQPTLSIIGLRTDTKSEHKFRLSPRNNGWNRRLSDELIGVFSELKVRHAAQESR
mmetsp:Transcript_7518/g.18428  ORF Transcript_7518/g.18428 Transcript_7518/m.18428 type:complete len:295 (+) Transcript_7518:181-1065(+)|eukprot:CAMPEP_0116100484 /NCGR_PEP_ID=MMETSP0327-20121206/12313_1 /TAXON_ID=44447 /ORGANISM="Pseudo-nitzschia delicatissima, Strain B596" /LENGTH=294 /DNA_ID=CAMNT_0003592405 /DNA_START=70 /DNA_END=954 /DNA_ORIENTATION=+